MKISSSFSWFLIVGLSILGRTISRNWTAHYVYDGHASNIDYANAANLVLVHPWIIEKGTKI